MKNHFSRVLALIIALVLCAPICAMADSASNMMNATLALSNIHLTVGEEIDATIDVTAQLDITADMDAGNVAATLTALSGKSKALKGGVSFDASTMELVAGLEGMTDAILLPMAEIIEQAQAQMQGQLDSMLPGADMEKVQNVVNALMNLVAVAENSDSTAIQGIFMNWVGEQIIPAATGVSLDVHDTTITVDQYDFEITAQELVTLAADLIKAVQADAELTAAAQAYVDAIIDLTGEDAQIDIAGLDIDAMLAEMPDDEVFTLAGSFYMNSTEGHVVLDMTVSQTEYGETTVIPYQLAVLNLGDSTYVGYHSEMEQYGNVTAISVDVNAQNGDAPVFDVTVSVNTAGDSSENTSTLTFAVDCTDGANVTLYFENSDAFTYNDQTYKSLQAFGANYAGTTVADEKGIACPGTLTLYVNNEGMEITVTADTLASLTNASNVEFNMPKNLINVLEADEDTMSALGEEFMEALSRGAMILMGAPGMENITSMIGG